jgi:hypothetical protein
LVCFGSDLLDGSNLVQSAAAIDETRAGFENLHRAISGASA